MPKPQNIESKMSFLSHPIHPMLVHFPVAALVGLMISDFIYIYTHNPFWARASFLLAGTGTIAGAFAALIGWIDQLIVRQIRRLIIASCHGVIAIMMLSCSTFNWLLRMDNMEQYIFPWGIYMSILTCIIIALTSYLGGRLVYEYGVGVDIEP